MTEAFAPPRWLEPDRLVGISVAAILLLLGLLEIGGLPLKLLIAFGWLHQGMTAGPKLAPRLPAWIRLFTGLLFIIAAQALLQSAAYYAGWHLGITTDAVSAALAMLAATALPRRAPVDAEQTEGGSRMEWGFGIVCLASAAAAAGYILLGAAHHATAEAIRTPWPLMPPGTLLAFGLVSAAAIIAAWRSRRREIVAAISAAGLFAMSSVTVLAYRLGYGFDGFLHRASERILLETGTLNPKPLYYIGQYVFTTWLARFFDLPIAEVDKWLLPATVAILPFAVLLAMKRLSPESAAGLIALIPLGAFVTTTPQGFAYALGLIALGLAIASIQNLASPLPAILLAFWSLAVHPLAGLPFLGVVIALLLLGNGASALRVIGSIGAILVAVASVPLAFYANSLTSGQGVVWHLDRLFSTGFWQQMLAAAMPPANHAALWPDLAATVAYLLPLALLALAGLAIGKDAERRHGWIVLTVGALGIALSGLLMKTAGEFTFLIDYERGNYAERLFVIAELVLVLPALRGLGVALSRLRGASVASLAFALFLVAWTAGNAYTALPRHDAAAASRGWSVSKADAEAVRWIEQDAQGAPYVVLANQSVSASAVEQFGFKRYVRTDEGEEVFYYPIPTGGTLYQLYLQATAPSPSFEAIREAGLLTESTIVYVVVNTYWWDAERVRAALAGRAETSHVFGDGAVNVYRFSISDSN